jgi:restriction system protein
MFRCPFWMLEKLMARRKSLVAQVYAARQKAKLERQKEEARASREWAAQQRRNATQLAKEEAEARRKAEQAERAKLQQAAQAERLAATKQREAARQAAATAREGQQRAAAERRTTAERHAAEAEFRTTAVETRVAAFDRLLADRNCILAALSAGIEEAFNTGGPEALVDAVQKALATSAYPEGLDGSCAARYVPEAAELWVEYELPRQNVIPSATAYKYVKARDEIAPTPRKQAQTDQLYEKLIARLALRTLAEAFYAAPVTLVAGIVFNGYVSAKDRATGQPVRPLLLSVHADRDAFNRIVLDEPELDPTACLRAYLNAVISPHPWDLEPVKPVLQFDLSRYKFVDEMSVVAGLDSRPDLLALKPVEFEHLIRELFEAKGLKSWVTQASKDEGVDGVAVNEDPIVGGLCIIQAKRYSRIVELESVHALAGVMDDMNAAKGVLVTTSWVGKASRDFAARNGNRIQIIEGRELKHLLREHLGVDALISLPKLPPGWEQHDLT